MSLFVLKVLAEVASKGGSPKNSSPRQSRSDRGGLTPTQRKALRDYTTGRVGVRTLSRMLRGSGDRGMSALNSVLRWNGNRTMY